MSAFTIHLNAPQAQALLDVVGQIISKGLCKETVADKIVTAEANEAPEAPAKKIQVVDEKIKALPVQAITTAKTKKIVRKRKVPTSTEKALHEIGSDPAPAQAT